MMQTNTLSILFAAFMVTDLRIYVQKSALIDAQCLPSVLLDAIHSIATAFMVTIIRICGQKSALMVALCLPSVQLNIEPIELTPLMLTN
jgi:hypothetical protein